jgi:hypothetical protein
VAVAEVKFLKRVKEDVQFVHRNPIAELRAHGSLKMKFGQSHVKVLARLAES